MDPETCLKPQLRAWHSEDSLQNKEMDLQWWVRDLIVCLGVMRLQTGRLGS